MLIRRRLPLLVLVAAFVATAAVGLIFTRPGPESYDAKIMLQVTRSLVDHHSFRVTNDEFGFNTPYASYGLGQSLLFAVPYAVGGVNAAMTANAWVLALAVVAVVALARRLGLSWGRSLVVGFLIGAGTMLLPYVPTGFSEPAIAALVAVGLLAVAAARAGRPWAAVVGGMAAGASVLFRTDSVLLVVPAIGAGVWWAAGRDQRRKTVVRFGAGAAPFLLFVGWYNAYRFGSPFRLGYKGTAGFSYPFVRGLQGLLISPGRGLVWYVPLALVALAGARRAWRRDPVLAATAAILLIARPLLYASWSQWEGGVCWGPRFLVPAMPALAVGVAEVVRGFASWRVVARVALVAVMALSVGVQVVGTTIGYEHHWNKVRPLDVADGDPTGQDFLYRWKYSPIVQEVKWFGARTDLYVGRAVPPSRRPKLFLGLMGLGLVAAAGAVAAARQLDRRSARPNGTELRKNDSLAVPVP